MPTWAVTTITEEKWPELLQNSHVGFRSLRAWTSSKTSLVQLALSRWRPIYKKWRVPLFSKCRNSGNNGSNCTIFGAQGDLRRPFDFSTFDPCVTSRDLSMTLTVFKRILRKWTLAPKLLGLEWCNLGKSYNKGLYSGFSIFSSA